MPEIHARRSPSSFQQLKLCPGSGRMQDNISEQDNEYSVEGTLMHEALETKDFSKLDEKQKAEAEKCIELVERIAPFDKWQKEVRVEILDPFEVITWGTADLVFKDKDIVFAGDWKFGFNKVHAVKDNLQCKCYALGLIQKYNKPVNFTIIQPRINYINSHTFEISEQDLILQELKDILSVSEGKELILVPGEYQCRYCKAQSICPAVQKQLENNPLQKIEHTHDLSIEQISKNLEIWQLLKKVGYNLENTAKEMLIKGEDIPGWTIQKRSGARKCNNAIDLFHDVKNYINSSEFISTCNPSISNLEKLFENNYKTQTGKTKKEGKEVFANLTQKSIIRSSDTVTLKSVK